MRNGFISAALAATVVSFFSMTGCAIHDYALAREDLSVPDYAAAKENFERLLENGEDAPFAAKAHFWLGLIYMDENADYMDFDIAKGHFDAVVANHPDNSLAVPSASLSTAIEDLQRRTSVVNRIVTRARAIQRETEEETAAESERDRSRRRADEPPPTPSVPVPEIQLILDELGVSVPE